MVRRRTSQIWYSRFRSIAFQYEKLYQVSCRVSSNTVDGTDQRLQWPPPSFKNDNERNALATLRRDVRNHSRITCDLCCISKCCCMTAIGGGGWGCGNCGGGGPALWNIRVGPFSWASYINCWGSVLVCNANFNFSYRAVENGCLWMQQRMNGFRPVGSIFPTDSRL